jgi:hypothetical protein
MNVVSERGGSRPVGFQRCRRSNQCDLALIVPEGMKKQVGGVNSGLIFGFTKAHGVYVLDRKQEG